jgi:hypothetical protein
MQSINELMQKQTMAPTVAKDDYFDFDSLVLLITKKVNERPRTYKGENGKVHHVSTLSFLAIKKLVRGFSFGLLVDLYKLCHEDELLVKNNWHANKEKSFARRFFIELQYNKKFCEVGVLYDLKKKELKTKKGALQLPLFAINV